MKTPLYSKIILLNLTNESADAPWLDHGVHVIKSHGFVLLTTLLMISVLSLLVLSLLQSLFLDFKMSNQLQANHHAFYQLEALAEQISQSIMAGSRPGCVLLQQEVNQTILKQKGCFLEKNSQMYHYIMTDLGFYPCLPILVKETRYSSHHWLLSMSSDLLPEHLLQLRLATLGQLLRSDLPKTDSVSVGIMSWQYRGSSS